MPANLRLGTLGARHLALNAASAHGSAVRRIMRAEPLSLGALALVVCAFYFWTAYSGLPGSGYYTLLTDAFLAGQTHLPLAPAPELLALPDVYDPAQNAPYRLHDASLYEGRYYLYFGPTPVLLVHLPLRAVGIEASDALAGALLASGGFLFALALMRFLVDRYRPQTSLATRLAAGLLLGLANVAPFLLRRPAVYEVAIAAGYFCTLAGLHLTLTGALRTRPSVARLAAGSLALGLAVGARPHLILALPVWLWAWRRAWLARHGWPRARVWLAAAALAPVAVCLALLGLYNLVRFGSPAEFGSTYQLAGINANALDRFDLDRVLPGAFFYLLAPPTVDVVFPFAHLDAAGTYPGTLSPLYAAGIEPVAGVLATTSLAALAFAAPALLLVGRERARESTVLAVVILGSGLLVLAAPVVTFDGATMRYAVDFATLLLLAALLVWLRVENASGRLARSAARIVGVVGVATAALFALAFSITGYYDGLRTANPGTYRAIERVFDFVPTLAARERGRPLLLTTLGTGAPVVTSMVRVAAPRDGRAPLTATLVTNPGLPDGTRVRVEVDAQPGGGRRTLRVVSGRTRTVTVALRSGVNEITLRWTAVGLPGVAAGFGVEGVRIGAVEPVTGPPAPIASIA